MTFSGADSQPAVGPRALLRPRRRWPGGGSRDGNVQRPRADGITLAPQRGLAVLERVPNPCHLELVDLDRDGRRDLIVADLGQLLPSDHLRGSMVWLQRQRDGGDRKYSRQPLGRLAAPGDEVQPRCDRRAELLVGRRREAITAQDGRRQLSFLARDPRDVLGLGAATKLDWLEIQWPQPSGVVERLTDVPVDRYVTWVEGKRVPLRKV